MVMSKITDWFRRWQHTFIMLAIFGSSAIVSIGGISLIAYTIRKLLNAHF